MFLRHPSPVASLFESLMRKVFFKVCDLKALTSAPHNNQANTASGYAIAGARGVGKSHLLRLVNVLAPLLLPEAVSVYFSAGAVEATPMELLQQACDYAGDKWAWSMEPGALPLFMSSAARHGRVLVLCVDELRLVYSDNVFWRQLHSLTDGYYQAVFVSDSGSQLRALVKGDTWAESGALQRLVWRGARFAE